MRPSAISYPSMTYDNDWSLSTFSAIIKYLYGYKVWLIKGLEETPVTKYQTNNGVDDNALLVDTNQIIKKNETIPEMKDGYIIVADKPEDMTCIWIINITFNSYFYIV